MGIAPLRFDKRFACRETETLRDIRLYGNIATMVRWGAHDPMAWDKYVSRITSMAYLAITAPFRLTTVFQASTRFFISASPTL
jgi:hypothetical protein